MSQSMILLVWVARATALLLVATGLTMALRRAPAGARYVVWLATLVTLLVIPAVSSWSPIQVRILPASVAPSAFSSTPDVLFTAIFRTYFLNMLGPNILDNCSCSTKTSIGP